MLRSGLALFLTGSLATGCLVSFDGYQPRDTGGTGDVAANTGSDAAGGKSSGGGSKASGGNSTAGTDSGGTNSEPVGGEGGSNATGGNATGGNATGGTSAGGKAGNGSGGAMGGNAGSGGTTAGAGGKGAGGKGGGGGASGGGGSGAKTCPDNLDGPPMVDVPTPSGGIFCMDRTEVTNGDYAKFLTAGIPTTGQVTECSWNDSFQPDTTIACTAAQGAYDPTLRPRVPVSCIDWCDAKRYCKWTGKRLCGAISGGSNPPTSYIDANASQWYRACSKAGTLKFPYGNSYQPDYCLGIDDSGVHPSPVATNPACIGGYNGLYDLSGNVAEWEDSCSGANGSDDTCLTRGGSIQSAESTAPSLLCNDSAITDATPMPATAKRSSKDEMVGFRCCYDP